MPAPKKYTQPIFDRIYYMDDPEVYGYLGLNYEVINKLIAIRTDLKISQHDLAKKSGITQPTIARMEAGRSSPTLKQLIKLAKALGQKITFEPAEFKVEKYVDFTDKE